MEIISLNGSWQVRQVTEKEWLPATVPGCIHTDLMAAAVIPDPFYRDNEQQALWVGEADWLYRRTFVVPDNLLQHERIILRCDGLDTVATLWLGGREVGRVDNMFRSWEFDVRPFLQPGINEIVVCFDSALRLGQAKLAERYIHSWSTDSHKLPGGNYVRKAQCHFGWDWGPQLVTCGIWRDISLVAFDTARLADVHVRQDHSQPGQVRLSCRIVAERVGQPPAGVRLKAACRVTFAGKEIDSTMLELSGETAVAALVIADPQLWWPNGLGEQPLYSLTVTLMDELNRPLDSWQRKIGLRTLRLVRQPDEWGESFHFACNGVPFFAKGANWIPADSFIPRLTPDHYRRLLQAAAGAHMNMLRVWGGGIYEQPVFYDLCDELGLCVWQDFMFACATYPTFNDDFMANVAQEARENIRRLRHHPCLALWCGNNELEQGLVQETWSSWAMSWEDYGKLFDRLLPQLVAELDPDTDYWPGSPHTPHEDRRYWNDPRWGDAHIWDVWHGMEPFEFYYTCFHRFNSEFGFQSFPEPQTVRTFTTAEDENITSYIMEYHQRSPSGNSKVMHYLLDWFRLPTSFSMTLWLSQILQGMAVKHAVEHWRRTMPRGMGTLYWQLNDCWPAASWSSLDYDGRPKALHYMARRFFAPLLISGVADREAGNVAVCVTNDGRRQVAGTVRWQVLTVEGKQLAGGEVPATIPAGQNIAVTTLDLQDALAAAPAGRGPFAPGGRHLLVWLELYVGNVVVSENLVLFARPKQLSLADPKIEWVVEAAGDGCYRVTLTAAKPALWVWRETKAPLIEVSDNFFHLRPNQSKTASLSVSGSPLDVDAVREALTVYSLVDTYR